MIRELLNSLQGERRAITWESVFATSAPVTASNQVVNHDTALTVSAVYAAVRILSDGVSTLPVAGFKRTGTASERLAKQPAFLTFQSGPTKAEVIGQTMVSLLLDGNAFLFISWQGAEIVGLTVLNPSAVAIGEVDGTYEIEGKTYTDREILHIAGMQMPGAERGLSPIALAEETIGLSMASLEFGANFFGNGGIPGQTVEVPGQLSEAGVNQLKAAWKQSHGGSNSGGLAVLTEGAKFSQITVNPNEAQFLETRKFQVTDIARIYGVPPHLLQDNSGTSAWGAGLSEMNAAYVQHSLRPWIERIEQSFTRLLVMQGKPNEFVRFNTGELLRGRPQEKMDVYLKGVQYGIYSLNEIREFEDLPPVPGGDVHLVPLSVGSLEEAITPKTEEMSEQETARNLVEMVQKVYLGVNKVVTAEEAREMLISAGADITPDYEPPAPEPVVEVVETVPEDEPEGDPEVDAEASEEDAEDA